MKSDYYRDLAEFSSSGTQCEAREAKATMAIAVLLDGKARVTSECQSIDAFSGIVVALEKEITGGNLPQDEVDAALKSVNMNSERMFISDDSNILSFMFGGCLMAVMHCRMVRLAVS